MATVREDRRLGTIPTQREVGATGDAPGTAAATAEAGAAAASVAPGTAEPGTAAPGTVGHETTGHGTMGHGTAGRTAVVDAAAGAAAGAPASVTTAPAVAPLVPSPAPAPAVESIAPAEAPTVGATATATATAPVTEPARTDAPGTDAPRTDAPGTVPGTRVTSTGAPDAAPDLAPPAPAAPARRHRVRTALVVGAVSLVLGALVAGIVVKVQLDAQAAELARAQDRVATETAARAADARFLDQRTRAVELASSTAFRAAALADAAAVNQVAQGVLSVTPQAGDAPRAALQAAVDALGAVTATTGSGTNVAALRAAAAAVAAPQQAVFEAQAAWQAAEDARIAAERAAAEAAAAAEAQAAVRRANARPASRAPRQAAAPRASGGSAPAAAAAPAEAAGGWAAGVESYGVGGLGEAINAHRAANGLGPLSVSGSSSLANHAADMAARWSIWHSGRDHIVGYVQPASSSAMISAYANSASHNAWLLSGSSHVSIGAVTLDGRLFTAMSFS